MNSVQYDTAITRDRTNKAGILRTFFSVDECLYCANFYTHVVLAHVTL